MNDAGVYAKAIGVKFGVLSGEELRRMSVCTVEFEEAIEAGRIRKGGLLDLRMGNIDRNKCQTCESGHERCVGHFGRIALDGEGCVYQVGFIGYVIDILKCVCFHCSRLLCNKNSAAYKKILKIKAPQHRMKALLQYCKSQAECNFPHKNGNDGCLKEQPIIKKVDEVRIEVQFSKVFPEYSDKVKFYLEPQVALTILKRIDPVDYFILACDEKYCRPQWMIITDMPVPPTCVRPSNVSNAAARGEDDLTYKLLDIVRTARNLKSKTKSKASQTELQACKQMLQLYAASYLDNKAVGHQHIMQRMGRSQKGLRQKLKGKEGRMRGSLMGKRANFSARTVITPDPNIDVDEVGVPRSIAMNVTFPENVNKFNIQSLGQKVLNGPDSIDGAKFIILENGHDRIDLKKTDRSKIVLREGMKVERHMVNGDVILMNRQPSLHKFSVQAHR